MRLAGHVARIVEIRNSYKILAIKPEGKRLLGRPSHRWEENITMDLKEILCGSVDWIRVAQYRDQ